MDICTELANNLDYSVDVYYEDELITSFGNGNIYHKVDILYCYEYPKVYKESQAIQGIDDGPEIEPLPTQPDNFPGLWQEVFISLLIEHDLPYTDREKQLNYSLDPLTDEILSVSSPKVFYLADIETVLDSLKLPVPYEISSDMEVNTEILYKSIQKNKSWEIEYTVDNIRNLLGNIQNELSEQREYQKLIITKEAVKIHFNNKTLDFKPWIGFHLLSHLVENPNVEIKVLYLAWICGIIPDNIDNVDTKEYNEEQRIDESKVSEYEEYISIKEDLKRAKSLGDYIKAEKLEKDLNDLLLELNKPSEETKTPTEATPNEEKARTNIWGNINNALKYIKTKDQSLFKHFKGIKIAKRKWEGGALETGFKLVYKVPPGVKWKVIRQ